MKKKNSRKPYFPRVVPSLSTSSKVFVDRKTKSRRRRVLNMEAARQAKDF
jgi:hypothetical protein